MGMQVSVEGRWAKLLQKKCRDLDGPRKKGTVYPVKNTEEVVAWLEERSWSSG
jgi:hypothetical protein